MRIGIFIEKSRDKVGYMPETPEQKRLQRMIDVLEAAKRGELIEKRSTQIENPIWHVERNPIWDFDGFEYRAHFPSDSLKTGREAGEGAGNQGQESGYSPCGGCSPESTSDWAKCEGCRFNPEGLEAGEGEG